MLDILESAQRIIKVATGERYGDGMTITDIGKGTQYDSEAVWVTGNWNGELGGRLFKALERIGVEAEWYDENAPCSDCMKLMRTQPDCWFWQPNYLRDEEGQIVCFDCLDLYKDDVLEEFGYIDDYNKCIPDKLGEKLSEWGWAPYNGTYENGWHPGQDDKPSEIFDKIKKESPELSIVFRLDETSQFYIRFTAWTKDRRDEDEQED